MLLAIDAGNSKTAFALFDGDALKGQWRLPTDASRGTADYIAFLKKNGVENITGAIAACVVPQALPALRGMHKNLLVVGDPDVKTGLEMRVSAGVGADRIVNAAAAWRRYKQAALVIDMGTATTFDVVSDKGEFLGGAIAPGARMALEALRLGVANPLPQVEIAPGAVIGADTASAMQSGIYWGYAGLVEGLARKIIGEYSFPSPCRGEGRGGGKLGALSQESPSLTLPPAGGGDKKIMKVIATGGLAPIYAKSCPVIEQLEPDLTLWGLKEIYEINHP